MGNKDKTEKMFVACKDVFAEVINILVYQGEKILKEQDLLHALSGDERYLEKIEFMKEGGKDVCDLLDSMVNKGLQQGLQQGMQQGLQQGIQILIATYKELGITYEVAAAGVREKYALDDAEVQKDMELYW